MSKDIKKTSSLNKMTNIIMVDKNYMIDRRIILEAKSLIEAGYNVTLFMLRKSPQDPGIEIDDGLKIVRVFISDHASVKHDSLEKIPTLLPPMQTLLKICSEHDHPSQDILKQLRYLINVRLWQSFFSRVFRNQKLSTIVLYLTHPTYGLQQFYHSNLPVKIRYASMIVLSLLSGNFSIFKTLLSKLFNYSLNKKTKKKEKTIDPFAQSIISFLKRSNEKIDIVHAHDYPSLSAGHHLKSHYNCKLIYDSHELYSYQPNIPKLLGKCILKEEKEFSKNCDHIIVVNQQQAEIMGNDLDYSQFTALTNATNPPADFLIDKKYNLIREKINIPDDSHILIFQGGINRGRKIHLLLEGLAQTTDNSHMVFLTYGMEIPEFIQLSRNLDIEHRCHFLPPVPWDEIIYWLASADVGIMPYQPHDRNTELSNPNKLYEFITAGIPMIASSGLINVSRIMKEHNFGVLYNLVEANDYAAAINEMLDPSKGGPGRFRESLLKHREKFFWTHEAKKLIHLYDTI